MITTFHFNFVFKHSDRFLTGCLCSNNQSHLTNDRNSRRTQAHRPTLETLLNVNFSRNIKTFDKFLTRDREQRERFRSHVGQTQGLTFFLPLASQFQLRWACYNWFYFDFGWNKEPQFSFEQYTNLSYAGPTVVSYVAM